MNSGSDGGLLVELALRHAVDNHKDFERFADAARAWAGDLPLSVEEKESLLKKLAEEIKNF